MPDEKPQETGVSWPGVFQSVTEKLADSGLEAYRFHLAYRAGIRLRSPDILTNALHREDSRSGAAIVGSSKAFAIGAGAVALGVIGLVAMGNRQPQYVVAS